MKPPDRPPTSSPIRGWAPIIVTGAFIAISIAETWRPLRRRQEARARRTARNVAMAGLTAISMAILQPRLLFPLLAHVERNRLGLLHRIRMPAPVRVLAGVLLLDYTLWWWHWANHKVPFFWRFHLPHHVDRDLDASTAIRFHFGEMSLSVLFRMLQVRLLGISRMSMTMWQVLLMPAIAFQHSNIELTPRGDRAVSRWIITPRMHGIHHSDYRDETDSNWGSLFSFWDFLHGTFREDIPQEEIVIGVPAYQSPDDVTLPRVIEMPFREQRDDWRNACGELQISRTQTIDESSE